MSEIFTAPWYPWYADDILLSERVEVMNLAEEGAYRRALDRAWKKGSIPADPTLCARAIGKGCTKKIAEVVLTMFRPMDSDSTRMIQDRLEVVREEQKQKYLKNSAKGKKGMANRYHKDSPTITQLEPNYNHSESDTDSLRRESDDTREVSFAEQVMDGIRGELGLNQIAKESEWLIEIEIAKKNGFSIEHCIETFCLMNKQDWRDSAVRPGTWSEQLPILHKLRSKQNGTTKQPSEREKSASRTINAERMAIALETGDDETLRSILGVDGQNNIKGHLVG
jgi:uncharacterized protein YdaU (DUF1376 family)